MSERHLLFNEQSSISSLILNTLMRMSHEKGSPLISMAVILKLLSRWDYGGVADQHTKNKFDDLYIRMIRLIEILAEMKHSSKGGCLYENAGDSEQGQNLGD
jgi:hypothetical protein